MRPSFLLYAVDTHSRGSYPLGTALHAAVFTHTFHRRNKCVRSISGDDSTSAFHVAFMSLHFLSFGLSIINNATPVAIYLSQLIPPKCKIYNSTHAWRPLSKSQSHIVMKRGQLWSQVGTMVTALSKFIAYERRRTRELEYELQELRALTGMTTRQD